MMIGNYLKVTLRSMLRNRLFSVINVLGLGIGIAATVLIGLFVPLQPVAYDLGHAAAILFMVGAAVAHRRVGNCDRYMVDAPEIVHAIGVGNIGLAAQYIERGDVDVVNDVRGVVHAGEDCPGVRSPPGPSRWLR